MKKKLATETPAEKEARKARDREKAARFRVKKRAEDPNYAKKVAEQNRNFRANNPNYKKELNNRKKAEKLQSSGQQDLKSLFSKIASPFNPPNSQIHRQPLADITHTDNRKRNALWRIAPEGHTTKYWEYAKNDRVDS
ncbi:uncharacterized protein Z518_04402 [Rhinocladiella mackenziei CBS 650.93]|uniref:Rhinocladiella mackenziei CBS 650.93 unplaced genomic scaffold supercont1.3, whole genome shotgun sequence n=1 Tax=Rhinocladiella mackenziei CBS 650.93 TaxID=1442369 RepID=A0A0D2ITD1_9EURO|nr:uncharacterized protein Z518_04402 [Rhinocladiella mackenziei CBS 650.93]KIX06426.1 hypothetical protein Z518_04402 [Rhinocladiella mackenziei CBS 650.93]